MGLFERKVHSLDNHTHRPFVHFIGATRLSLSASQCVPFTQRAWGDAVTTRPEPFHVHRTLLSVVWLWQGTIVMTSPAFAQRLPDVYADPLEYQPDRYLPPREEDKATPFSFIGFGGGRHACLGQNFAYLQIKVCLDVHADQIRVRRNFLLSSETLKQH